jgi:hypothetical protein
MTISADATPLLQGLEIRDYDVQNLDDEIRVDRLCVNLLRHLYQELTQVNGMDGEQAGSCCRGADYFLREFIIGDRCENLFQIAPVRVRQFAGHWYITRTPEPNMVELKEILAGTTAFYKFLARQKLVSESLAEGVSEQCLELDYYQQRIDDFWAIADEGYDDWRQACPL